MKPTPLVPVKRMFWDIETSPNVCLSWRLGYKINLSHDNLLKERAIICIGYKWEGDKQVHALTWDKHQDDKAMLAAFSKVAEGADELVAHNGDSFDMPWLKSRCIFHGLPPLPDHKTVDTLQWARRKFYFNSNRLDYIAKYLGLGGKLKTEFGLWKDIVLKNDRSALARMVTYCKRDVALLEQVWKRMSLHIAVKTHAGVTAGLDKWTCPRTGSVNVKKHKTRITANGTRQHQMQSLADGGYYTIGDKAYREYLEARKKEAA